MGIFQSAMAHSPPPLARNEKLTALLRANHSHYEVMFNHRVFHNHVSHMLGAAYFLGASSKQLGEIYDDAVGVLVPWKEDTPQEVTYEDWRSYLGDTDYIRGFHDFFDDDIDDNRFDYKKSVLSFIRSDRDIASLFAGLYHSAISLGYALELNSKETAGEALNLWAADYLKDHDWSLEEQLLQQVPASPQVLTSDLLLQLLDSIRKDPKFLIITDHPISTAKHILAEKDLDAGQRLKFYFDMIDWDAMVSSQASIDNSVDSLLYTATALTCGTYKGDKFDSSFFLMHALTGGWALKNIIISLFENHPHSIKIAFKAYIFELLCIYIGQEMPHIDIKKITNYDCKGKSWDYVVDCALNGPDRFEIHYVKALRVLKDQTSDITKRLKSNDDDGLIIDYYKNAAVMLASEFPHEWIGFPSSKRLLDVTVSSK